MLKVYQIAAVNQIYEELDLAQTKLEENRTAYVSDETIETLSQELEELALSLSLEVNQADSTEKAEYLAELDAIMKEAPSAVDRTDAEGMEAVAADYTGRLAAVLDKAKAADQRKAEGAKEPDKKPAQTEPGDEKTKPETGKTEQGPAKPAQTVGTVPQTGDASPVLGYVLLAAVSACVFLGIFGKKMLRRRQATPGKGVFEWREGRFV